MNLLDQKHINQIRRKARRTSNVYHVYPIPEEKIHCLDITKTSIGDNVNVATCPEGQLCFCEPEVEDYTGEGGGTIVVHRKVNWQ